MRTHIYRIYTGVCLAGADGDDGMLCLSVSSKLGTVSDVRSKLGTVSDVRSKLGTVSDGMLCLSVTSKLGTASVAN